MRESSESRYIEVGSLPESRSENASNLPPGDHEMRPKDQNFC